METTQRERKVKHKISLENSEKCITEFNMSSKSTNSKLYKNNKNSTNDKTQHIFKTINISTEVSKHKETVADKFTSTEEKYFHDCKNNKKNLVIFNGSELKNRNSKTMLEKNIKIKKNKNPLVFLFKSSNKDVRQKVVGNLMTHKLFKCNKVYSEKNTSHQPVQVSKWSCQNHKGELSKERSSFNGLIKNISTSGKNQPMIQVQSWHDYIMKQNKNILTLENKEIPMKLKHTHDPTDPLNSEVNEIVEYNPPLHSEMFENPCTLDNNNFPDNKKHLMKSEKGDIMTFPVSNKTYWTYICQLILQNAIKETLVKEKSSQMQEEIKNYKHVLKTIGTNDRSRKIINQKIYEKLLQLQNVKNQTLYELLLAESPTREYDWVTFSEFLFNGIFSPEECRQYWYDFLKLKDKKKLSENEANMKLLKITAKQSYQKWINRAYNEYLKLESPIIGKWSFAEEEILLNLVGKHGEGNWAEVSREMKRRSSSQVRQKFNYLSTQRNRCHKLKMLPTKFASIETCIEKINKTCDKDKSFNISDSGKERFNAGLIKVIESRNIFPAKEDVTGGNMKNSLSCDDFLLSFFIFSMENLALENFVSDDYLDRILCLAKYFGHELQLPDNIEDILANPRLSNDSKNILELFKPKETLSKATNFSQPIETKNESIDYIVPDHDDTIVMEESWYPSGLHKDIIVSKMKRFLTDETNESNKCCKIISPSVQNFYIPPNQVTVLGARSILLSKSLLRKQMIRYQGYFPGKEISSNCDPEIIIPLFQQFQNNIEAVFSFSKALSFTQPIQQIEDINKLQSTHTSDYTPPNITCKYYELNDNHKLTYARRDFTCDRNTYYEPTIKKRKLDDNQTILEIKLENSRETDNSKHLKLCDPKDNNMPIPQASNKDKQQTTDSDTHTPLSTLSKNQIKEVDYNYEEIIVYMPDSQDFTCDGKTYT